MRDTAADSSRVLAGASPNQKGTVGGAPCASATRTTPGSTRRIRHEVLPSWKMSPPLASMAKSSSSEPTRVPSGSSTTRYWPVSGIAPPEVRAVMRARRVARSLPFTPSLWSSAPRPSVWSAATGTSAVGIM